MTRLKERKKLKNADAIIIDASTGSWKSADIETFAEKMTELGFTLRYESKGIQTWIRKPGSG